jgi:hypothetical protein
MLTDFRADSESEAQAQDEHRLEGELRYARGISYEVGSTYMPLATDLALQSVWAEALKHNTDETRDVMVATLEDLKANGPSEEEVARYRSDLERAWNNPGAVPGVLDMVSLTYLLKPEDVERDVLGEARALQPTEVREAAERFAAGEIFVVPQGSKMPRGYSAVPQWSKKKIRGKTFRPSRRTQAALTHRRLVQGDSGVTLVEDPGRFVSVAYEACEGVIQWSDGSRLLLGSDGFLLHLHPKDWRNGKRIVDGIDQQLSDRAVLMRTDPPAYTASGWDRGTYLRWALISGFFSLGAILNLFDPEHQSDGSWPFYLVMLLLLLPITLFNSWKYFLLRRRQ